MGLFSRKNSTRPTPPTIADSAVPPQHGSTACPPKKRRAASHYSTHMATVPDSPLPKAPDPHHDPAGYLRSIYAVRERCGLVLDRAKLNTLAHFNVDMSKFADTANYVVSIIKVR